MPDPAPRLRPDLYVVLRLLEALARNSNQLSRSALQRDARLNYTLFVRYLEVLQERRLVALIPGTEDAMVTLTSRGYQAYHFLLAGLTEILGKDRVLDSSTRASK